MLIFLFSLFVFLGVYIGVNLYQSYVSGRAYTERVTRCGQYSFDVYNVDYDSINLEFNVENTVGEEFNVLVVEVNGDIRENDLSSFSAGDISHITVENIQIEENFLVYPAGCKGHNAKELSVR
jgi:hypothetical protein